jgi:hypothetical protein
LGTSKDRLSGVLGAAAVSTNPTLAVTDGISALRESMDSLMLSGGRIACVHPYIHPIGDRRGDYAYLTPQQAAEAMAAKFSDPADLPQDDETTAVLLLLRGVDHAGFASTLAAFNALLPISPLQLAQRRAGWLSSLETDKLLNPDGPLRPGWGQTSAARNSTLSTAGRAVGTMAAISEAYALETTRPDDELAALISRKEAHILAATEAWEALSEALEGGAGLGLVLDGGHAAIRRQLLGDAPPVEGYALAAMCAWIGTNEQTTLIREALGL